MSARRWVHVVALVVLGVANAWNGARVDSIVPPALSWAVAVWCWALAGHLLGSLHFFRGDR